MSKRTIVVTLCCLMVGAGIALRAYRMWRNLGPTNLEVIEELRPTAAPIRDRIAEASRSLIDAPWSDQAEVAETIDPPVVYRSEDPDRTNVVFLAAIDYAADAAPASDFEMEDGFAFSVLSDNRWLGATLAWTSDENPLAQSVRNRNGSDMREKIERALATEYALIGYIDRDVDLGGSGPSPRLRGRADLIRLSTGERLARAPFVGPPVKPLEAYDWDALGRAALFSISKALDGRASFVEAP
ncbi:MAG: hypothetical protein AAF907_08910 [Planctomycetota bacterium]